MKHLQIEKPCTENWKQMNATQRGAFCQKCATEVIDFTNKSTEEIKSVFRSMAGQSMCSRISTQQLDDLNLEFENWSAMKSKSSFQSMWVFSLIVVFGLSLFSCKTEKDRKVIQQIQQSAGQLVSNESNPKNENAIVDESKTETFAWREIIEQPIELEIPVDLEQMIINDSFAEHRIEDVEVVYIDEYETHMLGGMMISRSYLTYLHETEVVEQQYDKNGILIPTTFQAKAFPNPATIATTLEIAFPTNDLFEIHLYDISGKELQLIHQGELEKGTHRFSIDLSEYPRGTYLMAIHSKKYNEIIRLIK